MGSNDTLKTAKRVRDAEDMSMDGCQDKHVRKSKKKERQKGRSIARKELDEYGTSNRRGKSK